MLSALRTASRNQRRSVLAGRNEGAPGDVRLFGRRNDLQCVVYTRDTEFEYVEISGERIGSRPSRQQRSSFIIASWVGAAGSVDMSSEDRPGRVDN